MNTNFLTGSALPFCKGCGHTSISEQTEKALRKLNYSPLDVVLVTDIGCHGIIDKHFVTHTVHGLHGRSVALASGVSAGMNDPDKKVIVFVGDGGATIGMQHLIDAAHNNFNLTVVIHNNFLYGMTGGQPSEFTPLGFKTPTLPEGATTSGYDICALVTVAGANYVRRVMGIGDISDSLAEAFAKKGFSLIEVMEICPSYGVKSNPGMKLSKVVDDAKLEIKLYVNKDNPAYFTSTKKNMPSLIDEGSNIETKYDSNVTDAVRIMMSGSAGEGIQSSAEYFAEAAISCGLNVTKKGSYPVTVGIGFSASDLIVSKKPIFYTGSPNPDILIITSQDGLDYARNAAKSMKKGLLFIDSSLPIPETEATVIVFDFREIAGVRTAALYALFYLLHYTKIFPIAALKEAFGKSKIAAKLDLEKLSTF